MLALKVNRVYPRLNINISPLYLTGGSSEILPVITWRNISHTSYNNDNVKENSMNFISRPAIAPFVFTATRFYSSQPPSVPSPPNLPDKQQMEKYFFKTIAFLWDVTVWAYLWSKRNFDKYIVQNPTVQVYWKQFLEKLEKSRRC